MNTARPRASGQRRVFLHVGAAKSGTTFLQEVLRTNRHALHAAGLLYPTVSHFRASQDLRNMRFQGYPDPRVPGAWGRLVKEVRRWPGDALIDHELLSGATAKQIDRAKADLGFADVHVIWTDRDLARKLPAAWQEGIKNRGTMPFADYLDAVQAGSRAGGRPARIFWSMHDAPTILARWSRGLPGDRVHIVTLPRPGADPALLWQRFAGVIGVDPDFCDIRVDGANTSLGAAEVAALRELNTLIADAEIPWPIYAAMIKHGVPARVSGRPRSSRIELPEAAYEWAVQWAHDAVTKLRVAGYDVVGDLDELVPTTRPVGHDPDRVPAEERTEAALAMLAAVLEIVAARGLKAPARRLAADWTRASRASATPGSRDSRLAELTVRVRWVAVRLRDAYRRRRDGPAVRLRWAKRRARW